VRLCTNSLFTSTRRARAKRVMHTKCHEAYILFIQVPTEQYSIQQHSPLSPSLFEQAPQGDPFAQEPATSPIELPRSPPRGVKRKRKGRNVVPSEECSFCQGHNGSNKVGDAELMVSCANCGRSGEYIQHYDCLSNSLSSVGHPSCLGIEGMADTVRSYPWYCIECKICEVCEKKGNEVCIL